MIALYECFISVLFLDVIDKAHSNVNKKPLKCLAVR